MAKNAQQSLSDDCLHKISQERFSGFEEKKTRFQQLQVLLNPKRPSLTGFTSQGRLSDHLDEINVPCFFVGPAAVQCFGVDLRNRVKTVREVKVAA